MQETNLSMEEALQLVQSIRTFVNPNPSFRKQLIKFEQSLKRIQQSSSSPPVVLSSESSTPGGT
jgi:hypothetical protein